MLAVYGSSLHGVQRIRTKCRDNVLKDPLLWVVDVPAIDR
jgi:hypothetical protein